MAHMYYIAIMMDTVLTVAMRKTLSVELQQDEAGASNPTVPKVENQEGTKNLDLPHREPDGRPQVIWIRLGQISDGPQRLGITEEH